MKAFTKLYATLEEAQEREQRVAALARYLAVAPEPDAAWTLRLLAGRRPERSVTPRELRAWACEAAGLPDWLFGKCREAVADLAETAALLDPEAGGGDDDRPLQDWLEQRLLPLTGLPPAERKAAVLSAWRQLGERRRVVWNKLLLGNLRPPITRPQAARALARVSGLEATVLKARLAAGFEPTAEGYRALLDPEADGADGDPADDTPAPEPHRLDAVLIYAQRGSGRRAAYYSELTFGLWHDGELVPFAKTGDGLAGDQLTRVDAFVRRHVLQRFGPVRAVEPRLVFTLAFDGVERSARRKSGLAVRAPRVVRWQVDKPPEDADELDAARCLLDRSTSSATRGAG